MEGARPARQERREGNNTLYAGDLQAKGEGKAKDGTEHEEEFPFTHFFWRAIWFTLAQTEGAEYKPQEVSDWNEQSALTALKIEREEFQQLTETFRATRSGAGRSP